MMQKQVEPLFTTALRWTDRRMLRLTPSTLLFLFTLMSCASVDSIRQREPIFRAVAQQDMIEFRNCVFDALAGTFTGTHKATNGVVIGADSRTVAVLIEQDDTHVSVYKIPYSLTRNFDLPEIAARECNKNPDAGVFGSFD